MAFRQEQLDELVQKAYSSLRRNNFATLGKPGQILWDAPFFGVSRGDDPLYDFLKEHIGAFHWTPLEAFRLAYPGEGDAAGLRVVSFCFPQTAESKASQSLETLHPSREWMVSRGEWEPMIREFLEKLCGSLREAGIRCVPVELLPGMTLHREGPQGLSATWSQRHAAYISGLGTFGLSDGLITEKGKAVRFSTVILEAPLEATQRPYSNHNEWCSFYKDGSCGVCMSRCPVSAISESGHDKTVCEDYEDVFVARYWPADIDRTHYKVGCGLCQAAIPCQDERPWK
jgi:epoxyqueuosine reductase QueG